MRTLTGLSLLAASVLLVACGSSDDNAPAPPPVTGGPPPGPVATLPADFNRYATIVATSTNRDAAEPLEVDTVVFSFSNDDDAAFSALFP